MPKIPTHTRQVTPSGRTGETFLSPNAANTGAGIEAAAFAELGQDIAGLGEARLELQKRSNRADDIISADQAAVIRREGLAEYRQFTVDNPGEPELWATKKTEITEGMQTQFSGITFNDQNIAR